MNEFVRSQPDVWHQQVPGARWFRADLHVHTLDDYPGRRIHWSGRGSEPLDHASLTAYAREFLRTAIARRVEVLGLTPHSVYCQRNESLSAVWRVVETWNNDADDDGVPFRDKVYAVFPGFEPSLADGARGVHLLFLFDPEIGREGLVRAFHAVMDGVDPWSQGRLNNAGKDAKDAFESIAGLCDRDDRWKWLCLAPHAFSADQGLFGQLKSQILQYFPHRAVAALELGDNLLPGDHLRGRDWLNTGMAKYHHTFFHASDAYSLNPDPRSTNLGELGSRTTVLKMAEPRIESLRQALLAGESRLRLAHRRQPGEDALGPADVPDPVPLGRPWLRTVRVTGGTSFFGGQDGPKMRSTTVRFNPDFTCIIGGRMSGKSTLLDGLRATFGYTLPSDQQVRADVEARATEAFSSGAPTIDIDICGPADPTCAVSVRWPAVFFTQRELQQAVKDQAGLRQLLFQLSPGKGSEMQSQFDDIAQLSRDLRASIPDLSMATQTLGEAEQALAASTASKEALERFESVGAAGFSVAQADVGRVRTAKSGIVTAASRLRSTLQAAQAVILDPIQSERITRVAKEETVLGVQGAIDGARARLAEAATSLDEAKEQLENLETAASDEVKSFRIELEGALAAAGGSAEELNKFVALSKTAALFEERRALVDSARSQLEAMRRQFEEKHRTREQLVEQHRTAMRGVTSAIEDRFDGAIRVVTRQCGVDDEFDAWVTTIRERGVTRWWNEAGRRFAPGQVLGALLEGRLADIGMSEQVSRTFAESITETRRWELQAVNSPDRYEVQLRVESNEYRPLARLSGGQQVSLLLSLLLESDDDRPLIIDQPEDELDKSYLFDTVLPALHRLKGHRQVIFATHDANIVVNGDADQVVFLQADADKGWVGVQGAIEQPLVKEALLTVLDGGPKAFALRSRKYGF